MFTPDLDLREISAQNESSAWTTESQTSFSLCLCSAADKKG